MFRKFYLILTAMVVIVAVAIVSCQKFDNKSIDEKSTNSVIQQTKAVGFGVHRKFYNVGKGYCFPPASECWDDIVIYGETLIKDFLAVIDKGNDKQIAEFTAKYIEELSKYIETEFLHEVIKENLVLSTLNNPEINTDFVIFTKKGDKEPFTVYPFVQK